MCIPKRDIGCSLRSLKVGWLFFYVVPYALPGLVVAFLVVHAVIIRYCLLVAVCMQLVKRISGRQRVHK